MKLLPIHAPRDFELVAGWLAQKENSADLIGGVDLGSERNQIWKLRAGGLRGGLAAARTEAAARLPDLQRIQDRFFQESTLWRPEKCQRLFDFARARH